MATQAYYIEVEAKVLALNESLAELLEVIDREVQQNDNGLLYPENYNVQGTLNVNLKALVRRAGIATKLLDRHLNDSLYKG